VDKRDLKEEEKRDEKGRISKEMTMEIRRREEYKGKIEEKEKEVMKKSKI
jgi:hypothetical protein